MIAIPRSCARVTASACRSGLAPFDVSSERPAGPPGRKEPIMHWHRELDLHHVGSGTVVLTYRVAR
jgi:hypothetical protein